MVPPEETYHSRSREASLAFARRIAEGLKPGAVVAFYGDLGSGKTTLIQGFCEVLGVEEPVTSPSFTIVQEYSGCCPVYHFDFYRLSSREEVAAIGFEEYLSPDSICFIEWPEAAEDLLPPSTLRIDIETMYTASLTVPTDRTITVGMPGNAAERAS